MITTIFSKSKPINLIIVFFITLAAFVASGYSKYHAGFLYHFSLMQIILFCASYGSVLLVNFIVIKNDLSKDANLEILLYGLFLLTFFHTTQNINILISNFFVLLALRRILSVRSQLNLVKKFFDAAFWIAIATLFYFWSVLFFFLIIVALIVYADKKINHWLIPFVGFLAVSVIYFSFSIVVYNSFFAPFVSLPEISFDYTYYNSASYLVSITTILSFGIWSTIFYLDNIKKKRKFFRASFSIVFLTVVLAFLIILFAPNKDGSEFLFMFAPLSIIIANYIETIDEAWFKEVFLSILIVVPFIVLALRL